MAVFEVAGEDPFSAARGELAVAPGQLPAFQATTPGMSITTIDVPSVQSKEAWASMLQQLALADGMVILRLSDKAEYDEVGYLYQSDFLSEIFEIVDSRPMLLISVITGPIRSSMMVFPGLSQLVLATLDSTFGFPDHSSHKVHPIIGLALKKRLSEQTQRRMQLVGDIIDATEAQRLGLVDFVGDQETVENEVCRLIYRTCSPQTQYYMYKPDLINASTTKEAEKSYVDE